jgi:hypothetical protein
MKYRYILAIALIAFSSTFAVAGVVNSVPVAIDAVNSNCVLINVRRCGCG